MQAIILGCGYLGARVAQHWLSRGDAVTAITRSAERARLLAEAGLQTCIADVTDPAAMARLPIADLVLYAIGYDRRAKATRREVVVDGLACSLRELSGKTRRLVFISSSSVYGTGDGSWVDEATPARPAQEAGRLALEAEDLVRAASLDAVILRLSGLYGPGRILRRLEQIRRGDPIAGDGEAWLNLIHVEDAARAVVLAADRLLGRADGDGDRMTCETYLVSDDAPMRRRDYYTMLAHAARAPAPMFDAAGASRIVALGKRCRNVLVKRELGFELGHSRVTEELLTALLPGESQK